MNKEETRPPPKYDNLQHHWLYSERCSYPTIAWWDNTRKKWFGIEETTSISPEEMFRRGWIWYAPCLPPYSPAKESAMEKGLDFQWER